MAKFLKSYAIYIAWAIALAAMLGSLYFSNYLGYAPCVLCWYQRICIYPLVFILPVGILTKDEKIYLYALPLTVAGVLISGYHNLLYYGFIPERLSPCTAGVSCLTRYVEYFNFLSIPLLSFLSLLAITFLIIIHWRLNKNA